MLMEAEQNSDTVKKITKISPDSGPPQISR